MIGLFVVPEMGMVTEGTLKLISKDFFNLMSLIACVRLSVILKIRVSDSWWLVK